MRESRLKFDKRLSKVICFIRHYAVARDRSRDRSRDRAWVHFCFGNSYLTTPLLCRQFLFDDAASLNEFFLVFRFCDNVFRCISHKLDRRRCQVSVRRRAASVFSDEHRGDGREEEESQGANQKARRSIQNQLHLVHFDVLLKFWSRFAALVAAIVLMALPTLGASALGTSAFGTMMMMMMVMVMVRWRWTMVMVVVVVVAWVTGIS